MKKFFAVIFTMLFIVSTLLAIIFMNTKLTLLNLDKIKEIAAESNFYGITSIYIKDVLVRENNVVLKDTGNLEVIDTIASEESVRNFIDESLGSLFAALKNPTNENLSFTLKFPPKNIVDFPYSFEKEVYLKNNNAFLLITKLWLAITIFGAVSLLLLLMIYLLAGMERGFLWLANSFLALGVVLTGIYFASTYFLPNQLVSLVGKLNLAVEPKLLNAINKFIATTVIHENNYLIIEIIIILLIGGILFYLSTLWKKEDKLDLMKGFDRNKSPLK